MNSNENTVQWFDHPRFDHGTDSDSFYARRARRERDAHRPVESHPKGI